VAENTADWTSQLRRGLLELCVLQVLKHSPSYGYEIVTTLAALGPLAAGENTLYPLLRRLKSEGLLETFSQASPSGPTRQYYRLSAAGVNRLRARRKEWDAMAKAVDACIKPNEDPRS